VSTIARLRRVSRKPPRYVVKRLADEVRREATRGVLWAAQSNRGPLAPNRVLGRNPDEAVQATATNARAIGRFAEAVDVARADAAVRAAIERRTDAAKERRVEAFGDAPLSVGIPPRWNEDARSGYDWPLGFHRSLDYVNRGRPSDIKVPWELSRFRYGVALAQAAAIGDEDALSALEADLADWRQSNPVGWSVNWAVGMEVALRAVNLVAIDALLLAAGADRRNRRALVASLYQHGWFLHRNLEVSDINGNHFLADAVGLLWLGRYFAGFGEARRWWTTGLEMVRSAARDQVLADGVDHEGSLPYHVLVLEMFLTARFIAPDELRAIDPVLGAMLQVLESACTPTGRVPDLGDNDGGRVLAFTDVPSDDGRRVLALGSALLGTDAPRPLDPDVVGDVFWLLGPEVSERIRATSRQAQRPRLFPDGGLAIIGAGDDHVAVDVGPIGFRGRGGHGHVDAMSLEAEIAGTLAIRDSGTGSYTGDPDLRNELRDVTAHSTVVIDGLPYATKDPSLLWAIRGDAPPTVERFDVDASDRHELIVRQELPAASGRGSWTRHVVWRPGVLELHDTVAAPVGSTVRATLQLPDDCELDGRTVRSSHHVYELAAPADAGVRLERARWSQRYGSTTEGTRAIVDVAAGEALVEIRWTVSAGSRASG